MLGLRSEAKEREAPRSRSRLTSPPHRSPRRPSPVRRKEPDYAVRLSSRPLVTLERDYHEVIHRCARLYVSADFSKVVSTWVKVSSLHQCFVSWFQCLTDGLAMIHVSSCPKDSYMMCRRSLWMLRAGRAQCGGCLSQSSFSMRWTMKSRPDRPQSRSGSLKAPSSGTRG